MDSENVHIGMIKQPRMLKGKIVSLIDNETYSYKSESFIKPKQDVIDWRNKSCIGNYPDSGLYLFIAYNHFAYNLLELGHWYCIDHDYSESQLITINSIMLKFLDYLICDNKLSTLLKDDLIYIFPKAYLHNISEFYDFYNSTKKRNNGLDFKYRNALNLFCANYGAKLCALNFRSNGWCDLLNQIHSPYLTDRIISEYNRSHSYHKSTTRFVSDDDDIVKYYYPVYKALLVDFNCRAWFSNLDIDKLIQNLRDAFSESSIRVNTIIKTPPCLEKQTLEVKQLCDTFVSDRDDLYKLRPVSENNIPGYCKQMIILHYKFIMNYEKMVAEIIG